MSGIFFASLPVQSLFNITDQDIPFFTVKRHHEKTAGSLTSLPFYLNRNAYFFFFI